MAHRGEARPLGAGFLDVAAVDEVPSEPPFLRVAIGERDVLLVRAADGTLLACAAACSHLSQPMTRGRLDGTVLECPHHCYAYDLADGSCVFPGPDEPGLEVFDLVVVDGRVLVRA
jgi:phenylpropionate dioxygenase-like ring-hydroxylating dioxygenase large terminal subunit